MTADEIRAEIERIRKSLGVAGVQKADRNVTYAGVDEKMKALSMLEGQLAKMVPQSAITGGQRTSYVRFTDD